MIPQTTGGKAVAGVTSVVGVVIIAIGVSLVNLNFVDVYRKELANTKMMQVARTSHNKTLVELWKMEKEARQATGLAMETTISTVMEAKHVLLNKKKPNKAHEHIPIVEFRLAQIRTQLDTWHRDMERVLNEMVMPLAEDGTLASRDLIRKKSKGLQSTPTIE
mmetsp:Transcript_121597/g.278719  ORF Transcript_121597/g.278719 Transcript_121597/m.278719 type:complete len:163 (+) Transcript_121597:792-1280(+)